MILFKNKINDLEKILNNNEGLNNYNNNYIQNLIENYTDDMDDSCAPASQERGNIYKK
jgi:hypothetical protein